MVTKKEKFLLKLTELSFSNVIFSFGIFIAIVSGFFVKDQSLQQIIFATLILVGFAIGIFCIDKNKNKEFLVASGIIVLTMTPIIPIAIQQNTQQIYNLSMFAYLIQSLLGNMSISQIITNISNYFAALIMPASILVALKLVFITTHSIKK